jgi:hypothetical protein
MNTARSGLGWPRSAKIVVAALLAAVVGLVLYETLGRSWIGGSYRPEVGGTVADWFSSVAALFAVPLSLLIMRSQLQLQRRELLDGQLDRLVKEAQSIRLAQANVSVELAVRTLIDCPDHQTSAESQQMIKWRQEMKNRGWTEDEGDRRWGNGAESLSTEELIGREPTSLLDKPWALFVDFRNLQGAPVEIVKLTVESRTGRTIVDESVGRSIDGSGATAWRVRPDRGKPPVFADRTSALAFARSVTVELHDIDGHRFEVSTGEAASR